MQTWYQGGLLFLPGTAKEKDRDKLACECHRGQPEHQGGGLGRWDQCHFHSTLRAWGDETFDFLFFFSLKSIFSCTVIFSSYWHLGCLYSPNFTWPIVVYRASLVAQMVKNLPAMREAGVSISGSGKISWRMEWLPTPIFWPGEFHGQRFLAGYSPWDHKDSDTTE